MLVACLPVIETDDLREGMVSMHCLETNVKPVRRTLEAEGITVAGKHT